MPQDQIEPCLAKKVRTARPFPTEVPKRLMKWYWGTRLGTPRKSLLEKNKKAPGTRDWAVLKSKKEDRDLRGLGGSDTELRGELK